MSTALRLPTRRYVIPFAAAGTVLLLSLGLWGALVRHEHAQIMATTTAQANNLQREIEGDIALRVLSIGRIAKRLEWDESIDQQEWGKSTELERVQIGALRSIAWVDTSLTVRWNVPQSESKIGTRLPRDQRRLEALARARSTGEPVLTHPIQLVGGHERTVRVYAMVNHRGHPMGHISGVLVLDAIVKDVVEELGHEYAFVLTDRGEPIAAANRDTLVPTKWHVTTEIPLYGTQWRLDVWPTSHHLLESHSVLPDLALLVGAVLSILIAWTIIAAQSARAAARHTTEVNARLEMENEARRQAEQTAELANRAKSDFLARMSHELRTPLNSVIGFANILRKNKNARLGNDELTYVDRIRANGAHLLGLVNDILDVSKIEAGRMSVERSEVDLVELIRHVAAELEGQPRAAGVDIRVTVPDEPVVLQTDSTKMRQVLTNLIGNALKFTPSGHVDVSLDVDPLLGFARAIRVTDTGIGIAPERQTRVFDPFEQGDNSTMRKYGGTGLGLSISRRLCELMGYQLTLQSTPGAGSVFTILFADVGARSSLPAA